MYGVYESLRAMRLPVGASSDSDVPIGNVTGLIPLGPKDASRASKLIRAGDDHAKFARGVITYFEMKFQVGWMMHLDTYRRGVETLSTSSSMHTDLKGLTGLELATKKQLDLPYKQYTRIAHLSYQALKYIYIARIHHRHPDWQIFCSFIESLPYFNQLIAPPGFTQHRYLGKSAHPLLINKKD